MFKTIFFIYISFILVNSCVLAQKADENSGTLKHPIVDSKMSKQETFDGLDPKCPKEIQNRQKIVKLKYYSFDGKIHQGQLVIDKDLVKDIRTIFKLALAEKFPIQSVIPVSHPNFRKNGRWDDDLSMIANNTSAFNYREKTGGGSLSNHAYGWAIDINTVQNPYIKGTLILPPNSIYNPNAVGTLTANHPITKKFIELGWDWGGNWTNLKDYQHFEKPLKQSIENSIALISKSAVNTHNFNCLFNKYGYPFGYLSLSLN